jgi:tetratricopeptide (TPR) repeat protein
MPKLKPKICLLLLAAVVFFYTGCAFAQAVLPEEQPALPKQVDDLIKQGTKFYEERNLDKAIQAFDKALPDISDPALRADILFVISSCYLQKGAMQQLTRKDQGFYKKAMEYANKCLAVNPRYWYALANLGTIYMNTGELTKADAYYEQAERLAGPGTAGYQQLVAQRAALKAALLKKEEGK